uniref:Uncharacterized protein n=1 Tax=Anguilla anguilla TaxID=7936 RepID=A0A0E9Q045_ANGAN
MFICLSRWLLHPCFKSNALVWCSYYVGDVCKMSCIQKLSINL